MIWLWPKHRPGQRQYCFFYHMNPALRGGGYVADLWRKV